MADVASFPGTISDIRLSVIGTRISVSPSSLLFFEIQPILTERDSRWAVYFVRLSLSTGEKGGMGRSSPSKNERGGEYFNKCTCAIGSLCPCKFVAKKILIRVV